MIELGHTTDREPPFRYAAYTRVGFSETDAQGVVYYGRYMPYFDLARTEYHRHLDLGRMRRGDGDFAMRASTVEYHSRRAVRRPARGLRARRADRHDEHHLRPRRLRLTDGEDDELMATAKQTLVWIDQARAAAAAGARPFRERILAFEGPAA